jgi:hypothetical protein
VPAVHPFTVSGPRGALPRDPDLALPCTFCHTGEREWVVRAQLIVARASVGVCEPSDKSTEPKFTY